MAKLLKLRRGTTSQHASFTGAEGEVTIDTTKDTAVVHDGAQAGGRPLAREDMTNVSSASIAGQLGTDSIATTKIAGGALPTDVTVTNANVVSNAAIAGTKISPNFGSQNISTTGNISVSGTNLNMSTAYIDFSGSLSSAPTTAAAIYRPADNSLAVSTGNSQRLLVNNSGASVTGNIAVSGTVDGRDVAADGSKLDGIEIGATADQSASEILTAIKTVDGSGTGLDADLLDGIQASSFIRSDIDDVCDRRITFANNSNDNEDTIASSTGSQGGIEIYNSGSGNDAFMAFHAGSDFAMYFGLDADTNDLSVGGWSMGSNKYRVWHANNDGSGSGLDADLWDGNQFSSYINQSLLTTSNVTHNQIFANDWFRVNGSTGIYWQTHGGGWQMTDTTWMRCYNGKALYVPNQIAATGNVTAYYSDERLKERTGTINDALSKVCQIETFYYKENDLAKSFGYNNGETQVGVSAQSVEKVMPEVVHLAPFDYETAEDGTISSKSGEDYKTVDYARLVPLLIESIKELKAEIDELKGGK